jgi:hypothetical protein
MSDLLNGLPTVVELQRHSNVPDSFTALYNWHRSMLQQSLLEKAWNLLDVDHRQSILQFLHPLAERGIRVKRAKRILTTLEASGDIAPGLRAMECDTSSPTAPHVPTFVKHLDQNCTHCDVAFHTPHMAVKEPDVLSDTTATEQVEDIDASSEGSWAPVQGAEKWSNSCSAEFHTLVVASGHCPEWTPKDAEHAPYEFDVEKLGQAAGKTLGRTTQHLVDDGEVNSESSCSSCEDTEEIDAFSAADVMVSGAGGVGAPTNGRYAQIGMWNGRPKFKHVAGSCIIYFENGAWYINDEDDTTAWFYKASQSDIDMPYCGAWTTEGYDGSDADPPPIVVDFDGRMSQEWVDKSKGKRLDTVQSDEQHEDLQTGSCIRVEGDTLQAWSGQDPMTMSIGDVGVVVKIGIRGLALIDWGYGLKRWVKPQDFKHMRITSSI